MKPYIGIVHQEAGSAYGITFPDAPGCFSASDRLDDIFTASEEALGLLLEIAVAGGLNVQQPRDLSELKDDVVWRDSFADAVLVIAISPPGLHLSTAA